MIKFLKYIFVLVLIVSNCYFLSAEKPGQLNGREDVNILQYSVPFLTIAPDSRAGAMGDVGAASTPDINSLHWNPAKYAMIKEDGGLSFSYTPWLRKLVNDINLLYLTSYYRLDDKQVIGGSLLYFSLGEIIFTGLDGYTIGQHTPNEFALAACYSRLLTEKLSMGTAFRFIRSDLTGGGYYNSEQSKAGISYAADFSLYYQTDLEIDDKASELAFGMNISNMGSKISYSEDKSEDEFIPTNLRLGGRLTMELDEYNSISFMADINKVLVPTSPEYSNDSTVIIAGKDPDVSVPQGIFQSFYDAPGGFKEELHELMYSIGAEYWYSNQFAIRGGYFHEHATKGNRKYFTLGIGLKLNVMSMDFAYLIPTATGNQSPLSGTMRFTLSFDFNKFSK